MNYWVLNILCISVLLLIFFCSVDVASSCSYLFAVQKVSLLLYMLLVALPLALCNDPTFGTIIAVGLLLCYIARAMELTLSLPLHPLIPCSQHKTLHHRIASSGCRYTCCRNNWETRAWVIMRSSCGLAAAAVGDRPTWGSGDCLDTYILPLDVSSVPRSCMIGHLPPPTPSCTPETCRLV